MTSEPVNPDDPTLSAYLLGELTPAERAEFEAKLERSPSARAELDSMEAVMDALSLGLREEWKRGLKVPDFALLPSAASPAVVVPARFRPSRKPVFAVAAALAATLAVLGALVSMRGGVEVHLSAETPASEREPAISVDNTGSTYEARLAVAVPQLFLTEEVATAPHADLATALASLDDSITRVDASYLESRAPTADFRGLREGQREFPGLAKVSLLDDGRVDSYLPPMLAAVELPFAAGSLEARLDPARPSPETSRVVISGYVPMDAAAAEGGASLPGFHPVSLSGNPVKEAPESELRLVSDFQSIQNELAELAGRLPEASPERAGLEGLLERNRRALSELKREFAR